LTAATIEFHTIKSKLGDGSGVLPNLHITNVLSLASVSTNAVVMIPAGGDVQVMRQIDHGLQIWKRRFVNERVPICIMIMHAGRRRLGAARLPVVVETDVAVAKIAQGDVLPRVLVPSLVQCHAAHDGFEQGLVDISSEQIPGSPSHRGCFGGGHGTHAQYGAQLPTMEGLGKVLVFQRNGI
jgi:hypothetical protein